MKCSVQNQKKQKLAQKRQKEHVCWKELKSSQKGELSWNKAKKETRKAVQLKLLEKSKKDILN